MVDMSMSMTMIWGLMSMRVSGIVMVVRVVMGVVVRILWIGRIGVP